MAFLHQAMSKVCHRCKRTLEHEFFNKNAHHKDGLASTCRDCMKVYRRDHYLSNRKEYIVKIRERDARVVADNKLKFKQFLSGKSCQDCGLSNPIVLEFDHRIPAEKHRNVSSMIGQGTSWDTILFEISKCDVVCANCHRVRTYRQFKTHRSSW